MLSFGWVWDSRKSSFTACDSDSLKSGTGPSLCSILADLDKVSGKFFGPIGYRQNFTGFKRVSFGNPCGGLGNMVGALCLANKVFRKQITSPKSRQT